MKPFTLKDAQEASIKELRPSIVKAVNSLLAKNLNRKRAIITQDEIIARAIEISTDMWVQDGRPNWYSPLTREQIFAEKMLDIEEAYRAAGWDVEYDKPAYDENYTAYFKFEWSGV